MKLVNIGIFLLILISSDLVYSEPIENEVLDDSSSYCKYIAEKNKAKSISLRSPDAIVRVDNGNYDNNFQKRVVSGLSKDLSDFSKAKQIDQLIYDECRYYQLSQKATLQIQYAIPIVKAQALKMKLQQIQVAKNKLNKLLRVVKQRVHEQNDTIQTYYQIDSSLKKLEYSELQINVDLASQKLPKTEPVNLHTLLKKIAIAQRQRQATLIKLEKQDNWSVQLQAGAQKILSQDHFSYQNQNIQPYFAVLLRYNLGAIISKNHIDNSLDGYMNWQRKQVTGIQSQLSNLIISITALKAAEEQRLLSLTENYQKYYTLTKKIKTIDTFDAVRFKQQVEVDRIMMEIEIKYLQRLIALLQTIME